MRATIASRISSDAVLRASEDALAALHHQQFLDLPHNTFGVGCRKIDLIDHWDDRQAVLDR
jgi:hypothetical protein